MPPKKKPNEASKKTVDKQKQKVIEDKTFGIKNKKGAKAQKFIQQVNKQVVNSNVKKPDEKKDGKKDEKKIQEELMKLFKPVQAAQKISKGVDPKSVLCAFFKQGQCQKGDKCKFSHDLSVERKGEKRSLYFDEKDADANDTMENWDEGKLEEVIEKKHGEETRPKTEIICKHFLDAVESSKYGWFWECPAGEKCMYRHRLPPGFILKKDKEKMQEQQEKITIEELVEKERTALGHNLTPVTLESFLMWKKRKLKTKAAKRTADTDKKKAEFKTGKSSGLSGREMFTFRPELADEDTDNDDDEATFHRVVIEEDEEPGHELNLEELQKQARNYTHTDSITTKSTDPSSQSQPVTNGLSNNVDVEHDKLNEAAAPVPTETSELDEAIALANSATLGDIEIDEDLFDADLDDLDEDMETLVLDD